MAKASNRVTLPEATASFMDVFVATGMEGFDPKFSATQIFDSGQDLSSLDAAVAAAIERKWPEGPPKKNFAGNPIKDGNDRTDSDGNIRPEYAGKQYIVAKSKETDAPGVVDITCQAILDSKAIYGGCRTRLAVSAYGWTFAGKSGVSLYLNNVQLVADGEPFGLPQTTAEDDFS